MTTFYEDNPLANLRFSAVLPDGRRLVSCHGRNAVFIVDDEGIEIGQLAADFASPEGIAVAGDRLYVVDRHHHCVHVFDSASLLHLRTIGGHGAGPGQFNQPVGIAVGDGRIWVADNENHRIQALSAADDGSPPLIIMGSYGTAPGQFFCPCGIALYTHRTHGELVVVSEWGGGRVQVLKVADGTVFSMFGGVPHAHSVAVDYMGMVCVANYAERKVQRFSLTGGWKAFSQSVVSVDAQGVLVFQKRLERLERKPEEAKKERFQKLLERKPEARNDRQNRKRKAVRPP